MINSISGTNLLPGYFFVLFRSVLTEFERMVQKTLVVFIKTIGLKLDKKKLFLREDTLVETDAKKGYWRRNWLIKNHIFDSIIMNFGENYNQ